MITRVQLPARERPASTLVRIAVVSLTLWLISLFVAVRLLDKGTPPLRRFLASKGLFFDGLVAPTGEALAQLGDHDRNELRKAGISTAPSETERVPRVMAERPRYEVPVEAVPVARAAVGKVGANLEILDEASAFEALGLWPGRAAAWNALRAERASEQEAALYRNALRTLGAAVPPEPVLLLKEEEDRSRLNVVIDWPHSTFAFSPHNYAALESLLANHPTAAVASQLVAPEMARKFRFSNAQSFSQFERYPKLGYDVTTTIVNAAQTLFTDNFAPGQRWWRANRARCCPRTVDFMTHFMHDDLDVVPAASTSLFLRLVRLWTHGGVSTDLTVFFTRPVPRGTTGFAIGGSGCGRDLAKDMYHARAPDPMVLAFGERRSAGAACVLRKFDACCDSVDSEACSEALGRAPRDALQSCFEKLGLENQLDRSVEWFGCQSAHARSAHTSAPDETARLAFANPLKLAFWLGPDATDGAWRQPEPGSLVRAAYDALPHVRVAATCNASRAIKWCEPLRAAPSGHASIAQASDRDLRIAAQSCAPRVLIPAAQKGASSYLFSLLATHPQVLRPLSQTKREGVSLFLKRHEDAKREREREREKEAAFSLFLPQETQLLRSHLGSRPRPHQRERASRRGSHYKEPGAYINAVFTHQRTARQEP